MKRVHVSSVANAGEDERVEFKGEVHTRALQQGQCVANVKSIVVPQQFRNSSAEMWVSAQARESIDYEIMDPNYSGGTWDDDVLNNTLDNIDFLKNTADGSKFYWKRSTSGSPVNSVVWTLEHSSGSSTYPYPAHTKIRPAKWASDEEALENINSAMRCTIMNRYNPSNAFGIVMREIPSEVVANIYPSGRLSFNKFNYAFEFYFYSRVEQEAEIILDFYPYDNNDAVYFTVNLGTFSTEADKFYRISPYDVFEKIQETTATSHSEQIASNYHKTKEVRRSQFFRSDAQTYGNAENRMDIYQAVAARKSGRRKPGDSAPTNYYDGSVFVVEHYQLNVGNFLRTSYLPEIAQLQKIMSPTGPLVDLRLDQKRDYKLVFNETMKYRLQLNPNKIIASSVRTQGQLNPQESYGFEIVHRDLQKLVETQRSLLYPIFNDVYDVSIQKGDEVGRVKVKRGKTARATSDIVHFRQSSGTSAYPENMLIDGQSSIDMGSNALDQTGFITLHNPLTLEDERLPLRNKLQGKAVATMDVDLVNVEQ
jgi:hypothetical protein